MWYLTFTLWCYALLNKHGNKFLGKQLGQEISVSFLCMQKLNTYNFILGFMTFRTVIDWFLLFIIYTVITFCYNTMSKLMKEINRWWMYVSISLSLSLSTYIYIWEILGNGFHTPCILFCNIIVMARISYTLFTQYSYCILKTDTSSFMVCFLQIGNTFKNLFHYFVGIIILGVRNTLQDHKLTDFLSLFHYCEEMP